MSISVFRISADAAEIDNSCSNMFEQFCEKVWSKENMGNIDIVIDKKTYSIRRGRTDNEIDQARFAFLTAVQDKITTYPKDIRDSLVKNKIPAKIKSYLKRKKKSQFVESDLWREEWNPKLVSVILESLDQVADARTEKQMPGFLKKRLWDLTPEMKLIRDRNRDLVEAEFFQGTWEKHKNWLETEKIFETVRAEYILWVSEQNDIPDSQKSEFIDDLKTLKLQLPGTNVSRINSKNRDCAIDERNAFYSSAFHTVTVCAGQFNTANSLLTIAHEVGHALGIDRRLYNYRTRSLVGKQMGIFWDQSCKGELLKCSDWARFKKDFRKNSEALKPYEYYDEESLKTFVSKPLNSPPSKAAIEKTSERLSKRTMRFLVGEGEVEKILKPENILPSGERITNFQHLNYCKGQKWPLVQQATVSDGHQFMLFFANEYFCQKENKAYDVDALEKSVEVSTGLIKSTLYNNLVIGGKFADEKENVDGGYAQDIEEDVVDNYASQITARILKHTPSQESRRDLFFVMASGRCDPPSFRKLYHAEAKVIQQLGNKSHSVGLDRRTKLLIKDINSVLGCQ